MSQEQQATLLEEVTRMRTEFQSLKVLVATVLNEVGRPAEAKPMSQWLSGDEVCTLLGIPITRSNTHRLRLQWLREKGLLSRFGCMRPYTYAREEVMEVLRKIQKGTLVIPARA
jgi:hypothetical protein